MVLLRLNTNMVFNDKIFLPQGIEIDDMDSITVNFDEVIPSDFDILRVIMGKILRNIGEYSMYSIVFRKDFVIIINELSERIELIIDRYDGKVILNLSEQSELSEIRHLVESLFDTKLTIYISEGDFYFEESYYLLKNKNFEKGYMKFRNYLIREIRRNSQYCKKKKLNELRITLNFKVTSPLGTIRPYKISVNIKHKGYSENGDFSFIHPKYLCEFISKTPKNMFAVKQFGSTPTLISGSLIGNEFFNSIGKYKVKYVRKTRKVITTKYVRKTQEIITDKFDKKYYTNHICDNSEIIDVGDFTSFSTITSDDRILSLVSYNNELKYFEIDDPTSISDIDKYVHIFEKIFDTSIKYDKIRELIDYKTFIKITNTVERSINSH